MKNSGRLIIAFVLIVSLGVNSCTDKFEEINSDPNVLSQVTPELLLAGVMKSNLDVTGGTSNFWMYLQYGRYLGGLGGNEMLNFGIFNGFVDSYWNQYYQNCIKNARQVQDVWGDDPEYVNRVQISKALEVWTFSVVLSLWGPAPVTEAVGNSYFTVPFDTELEGYTFILNKLEEASDIMGETESTDALAVDPMFGGDNDKWLRFINTLRLKIALRISMARVPELAALGRTHITEVINDDLNNLITSNVHNAALSWGDNDVDNFSMLYERTAIQVSDNWPPIVADEIILWSNAYADPRISAFTNPPESLLVSTVEIDSAGTPIAVSYGVKHLGRPIGREAAFNGWDLRGIDNPLNNAELVNYSFINDEYQRADSEFMLISASETHFMLAEIMARNFATLPNPASVYYYDGIRLSFERYGVSGAEAYLAQPGVAYNTASTEDQVLNNWTSTTNTRILENEGIKQIVIQRWLTMFFQGHDAWCLQKRTNLLPWAPYMNPAQQTDPLDYPERMIYSPTDRQSDEGQYVRAIDLLGGQDRLTTPLAMNAVKVSTDWASFVPAWSNDFAKRWYGSTYDDLLATGLTDVTGLDQAVIDAALTNGTGFIRIQE